MKAIQELPLTLLPWLRAKHRRRLEWSAPSLFLIFIYQILFLICVAIIFHAILQTCIFIFIFFASVFFFLSSRLKSLKNSCDIRCRIMSVPFNGLNSAVPWRVMLKFDPDLKNIYRNKSNNKKQEQLIGPKDLLCLSLRVSFMGFAWSKIICVFIKMLNVQVERVNYKKNSNKNVWILKTNLNVPKKVLMPVFF